jgi:homogentisate 1,2-dioxygenase
MIFIHKGKGKLRTMMEISHLNMVTILSSPEVIYQIDFETSVNRLFYVESFAPFYTPKR